jgi:hypothetical protein
LENRFTHGDSDLRIIYTVAGVGVMEIDDMIIESD